MEMMKKSGSQETSSAFSFSIVIPSWNNLAFLKNCTAGIRENSATEHEIIIHVNEGSDGTLAWVKESGFLHTWNPANAGICIGLNSASALCNKNFLVYMNDDMYPLPGWDTRLSDAIRDAGDQAFFISSTMIEPVDTGNPCAIAPRDFGKAIETFDPGKLKTFHSGFRFRDWSGASWPPNVVTLDLWRKVGGYSEEFSPGMYSDPDFAMKLWKAGVRYFRGVGDSRVYHFQSKSTGKVLMNPGRQQFRKKWGISASVFAGVYLRRGREFKGALPEAGPGYRIAFARLTAGFRNIFTPRFPAKS